MRYIVALLILIAAGSVYGVWRFQEKLIFFPEKLPKNFQFTFPSLFYEEKFIRNGDAVINGLLFKVKKPIGVVIYFHGNAGSLRSWGNVAHNFLPYNYDVFIIDYRGFGKSTGKISEPALYADAELIYNVISPEYEKVIIYGRSIGSGIAIWLAEKKRPYKLLLETPFYNLSDLADYHYPWFPGYMLRYKFRNDLTIKNIRCPVYIIHGDDDKVIPVSFAIKLSENSLTQMVTTIVKGGSHNNLIDYYEYSAWLKESLK